MKGTALMLLLGLIFSGCLSLKRVTTLVPADSSIRQVDTAEMELGKWINHHSDTYECFSDSTVKLVMGTKFPTPTVSDGPFSGVAVPNLFYFYHVLFGASYHSFFMNMHLTSLQNDTLEVDLNKVHFYHLKDMRELGVDTIKFIPKEHWGLRESEIASIKFMPSVELANKFPSQPVIFVNSTAMLRFNLKINTYRLKKGLMIKFDEGFIINSQVKIPDIIFFRRDMYILVPMPFAS